MIKQIPCAFLLVFLLSACLSEPCIRTHVEEGKELNHSRDILYKTVTKGRSEPITKRLIDYENWAIAKLYLLEPITAPFRAKRIPMLCRELVSVKGAPAFLSYVQPHPRALLPSDYPKIEAIQSRLQEFASKRDFFGLQKQAFLEIIRLKEIPSYFCMTRHFLESIGSTAVQGPIYAAEAEQKKSYPWLAKTVSWMFLDAQIKDLKEMYEIDKMAVELQMEGVPILCQDVPAIPFKPTQSL